VRPLRSVDINQAMKWILELFWWSLPPGFKLWKVKVPVFMWRSYYLYDTSVHRTNPEEVDHTNQNKTQKNCWRTRDNEPRRAAHHDWTQGLMFTWRLYRRGALHLTSLPSLHLTSLPSLHLTSLPSGARPVHSFRPRCGCSFSPDSLPCGRRATASRCWSAVMEHALTRPEGPGPGYFMTNHRPLASSGSPPLPAEEKLTVMNSTPAAISSLAR